MNKLQWEMDTNRAILRANTLLAQSLALHSHPIPVVTWPVDGKVTMDPSYPQLPAIGPNDVSLLVKHGNWRCRRKGKEKMVDEERSLSFCTFISKQRICSKLVCLQECIEHD